ncbi:MAG: arginine deiminase [Bacillota bacterium]|jgi:arginine deiminase
MAENRLNVTSEVGILRKVLVHRPGPELQNLVPRYLEDLLFDEIPWLERAQEEHDGFVQLMRHEGVEVYYLEDLVTELVEDERLRQELVQQQLKFSPLAGNSEQLRVMQEYLNSLPPREMVDTLIAGVRKAAISHLKNRVTLGDLIKDSFPFALGPLPSFYFTRDHGTMIGEKLMISMMFNFARRRETVFLRFVERHHPLFQSVSPVFEEELPVGLEGGDVLVLSPDTLAIGLSQRTSEAAIEAAADWLLAETQLVDRILVISIPPKRAYMHLDTVFTMVDRDQFLIYPGIEDSIEVYRLERDGNGRVTASSEPDLVSALKSALRLPAVNLIRSGGDDPITAAREQWCDSTNTVALAPGKVITYNRTQVTNRVLRKAGIEVLEIEGSELVRGRGGPHCMTLPLLRED